MSEISRPIEQCDHFGCQHNGGREEYCEIRGKDPEADSAIVAEYIDHILFSTLDLAGSGVTYEVGEGYSCLQREFNLLSSDNRHWVWPLIETNVMIRRDKMSSPELVTYEVVTSWQVQQPAGIEEAPYVTTYFRL